MHFSSHRILFIFFFSFSLVGLLTGCKPVAHPPLQLIAWLSSAEKAHFKAQLAEFSLQNSGIQVDLIACNNRAQCRVEFESRFKVGQAPDVCMIAAQDLAYWIQSKKIRNLLAYQPDEQSFVSKIWEAFVQKDRLYALPFRWSTLVLYYNRTIFERHGIPFPQTSWEWGDLLTAAQALTVWDERHAETIQYGLEVSPSVETWAPLIWQNYGEFAREGGTCVLADPQFLQSNLQAIEFYADLVREHHVAPSLSLGGYSPKGSLFLTRKAAMTFGDRELGYYLQKRFPGEWDVTELPRGRQAASLLKVEGYAISTQTKYPDNAWKLISFLTRETCQAIMIQEGEHAPSWQSLLSSKIFLDFPGPRPVQNSVFINSLGFAKLPPRVPEWQKVSMVLAEEMSNLMMDPQISARRSIEQMQVQWDKSMYRK